jgi:hypothetical protein
MGFKKPENYSWDDWRFVGGQVGGMVRSGWVVEAECNTCHVRVSVNLERIERRLGTHFSLWGETAPCPCIVDGRRCPGRWAYYGRPPTRREGFTELTGPPCPMSSQALRKERIAKESLKGLPAWCQDVASLRAVVAQRGVCWYRCAVCKANGDVDLDRIIAEKGPSYSLVDRVGRCRSLVKCEGLVWFTAGKKVSEVYILRTKPLPSRRDQLKAADGAGRPPAQASSSR